MTGNNSRASDENLNRISFRIPPSLDETVEENYAEWGYTNKSEALRDAVRGLVDSKREEPDP